MFRFKIIMGGFVAALLLFPVFSSAQSVSIVSGNGQLVCPVCPGLTTQVFAPLIVQVNDSTGKPLANTTVTWTVTRQGVSPSTSTSNTNSSGQATYTSCPGETASCPLQPVIPFIGQSYLPATTTAAALGASAVFTDEVVVPSLQTPGLAPIEIALAPSGEPPALTGTAGQTATTPIKVVVLGTAGGGIQGIQVRIDSGTSSGQPTVSCASTPGQQPGTVFTDSTGTATCTPVYGGVLGTGNYTIVVGGNYATFVSAPLTVTHGPPAILKVITGGTQSVNPGVVAPVPLVAELTDLGGNPASGSAVTWAVTQGTATITNTTTTTDSNGQVTARVTPTAGPVTVVVSLVGNTAVQASFTINVNVIITALQALSGDKQIAQEGDAFADPLIVQVNDNTLPVPNVPVTFTVSPATGVTLSAASATTNAQGQAQVTASAGAAPATVTVTATVKNGTQTLTQTFTLTVNPHGALITSVVNSAGFQKSQAVAPCSLATIYGTGLTDNIQGVVTAFIAPQTQVANITVSFNNVLAPILDVVNLNGQQSVSVQVPCETPAPAANATAPVSVPMIVTVNGVASAPFPVNVATYSPGIFQFMDPSDGVTRAVLVRQDGSFVSAKNPAPRGETIRMYVTGMGQTNPPLFTNEFDPLVLDSSGGWVPQALPITASFVVGVNNGGVTIVSGNYAYGMVGVYEIAFVVPEKSPTGNNIPFAMFVIQGTNAIFGNPSLIPVQ